MLLEGFIVSEIGRILFEGVHCNGDWRSCLKGSSYRIGPWQVKEKKNTKFRDSDGATTPSWRLGIFVRVRAVPL